MVATPWEAKSVTVGDVPSQHGKSTIIVSPVDLTNALYKLWGWGALPTVWGPRRGSVMLLHLWRGWRATSLTPPGQGAPLQIFWGV